MEINNLSYFIKLLRNLKVEFEHQTQLETLKEDYFLMGVILEENTTLLLLALEDLLT